MLAARCLSKLVPPHVHLESPPPSPRVRCVARCSPMHARAACERRYWRLAASDDALPPPPAFASVRWRAGWGSVTRPRASFRSRPRCLQALPAAAGHDVHEVHPMDPGLLVCPMRLSPPRARIGAHTRNAARASSATTAYTGVVSRGHLYNSALPRQCGRP
jgi:hypothetical protein